MSATAIMYDLLTKHAPLLALVPKAKIFVGAIPQETALPAIGITLVSSFPKGRTTRRATSAETMEARVQVTVLTKSYPQLKKIILAAKLGGGVYTGVIAGYYTNSVIPWGENPELLPGDDGIYEQSRDFMVTFAEAN